MAKKIQSYNMMVAHSGDTNKFVETVKTAVEQFCELYNQFNTELLSFEVRDFNDAMFTTLSKEDTQEIVFEQFAGRADIAIALIGSRIGDGLRQELDSFIREKKQTFVYLYDGSLSIYSDLGNALKSLNDVQEIVKDFKDIGYSKVFTDEKMLTEHIIKDLARFIKYRKNTKYELIDKSYGRFAYDEVDRYRDEIQTLISSQNRRNSGGEKNECSVSDISQIAKRITEHAKTNILELMRLLRSMLAERFDLNYTDITVSFVWGYHDPNNTDEFLIIPHPDNVISLNHSGTPAKLIELLREPNSLLRYMLVEGEIYKWYQYKSFACAKGRYWWPSYEKSEKEKCQRKYASLEPQEPDERSCKTCVNSINLKQNRSAKETASDASSVAQANTKNCSDCSSKQTSCSNYKEDEQFGGSIFCYRIVLNGDAAKTNNYVAGYLMVSTYRRPFTNTIHDSIRAEVKQSIRTLIDYRVKPQLLVELSQLYIAHFYKPTISEEMKDLPYDACCMSIKNEFNERESQNKK